MLSAANEKFQEGPEFITIGDSQLPKLENHLTFSEGAKVEIGLEKGAEYVGRRLLETEKSFRVAVAQISTDPGRIADNTRKIIDAIEEAKRRGAQLVSFPELTIPGYCSMDLLFNPRYIEDNINALQTIREHTEGITAVVGFVDTEHGVRRPGGRPVLYNSAAIMRNGEILHVQDKALFPNYEIFFEDRYFCPARGRKAVQIDDLKIGTLICEDLWDDDYQEKPGEGLFEVGADLIVDINASPFHVGKSKVRESLLREKTTSLERPIIYTNLVGSFDGYEGEVVFDGRSVVMSAEGRILGQGKAFQEDLFIVDVFQGPELHLPEVEAVEELHDALVLGIRDYFRRQEKVSARAFQKAFVGVSGGIDSALVVALAVEALGPDRVVGITMPSKYSSSETVTDAELTSQRLGIQLRTVPIQHEFDACLDTLTRDPEIKAMPEDVSEENIQARVRMINLMYYANKLGGVVLNTGNKTELALNNCTIYGDMVGGFSVLGDVDKDRVYELSRYINARAAKELIPYSTIERVPTAELKPDQTDAAVMGAHPAVIAPMVRDIVEEGLPLAQAVERYKKQFAAEVIDSTFRKLDNSEWKRRQAAPAIRVTAHAFGNGRRVPMGHGYWK